MSIEYPISLSPQPTGRINRKRPIKSSDYASGNSADPSVCEGLHYLHRKDRTLMGGVGFGTDDGSGGSKDAFKNSASSSDSDSTKQTSTTESIDLDLIQLGGRPKRPLLNSNGNEYYEIECVWRGKGGTVEFELYDWEEYTSSLNPGGRSILSSVQVSGNVSTAQWHRTIFDVQKSDLTSGFVGCYLYAWSGSSFAEVEVHQINLYESDIRDPQTNTKTEILSP